MITAFVFIKVDPDQIPEAAQQIAAIDQVAEVYSVTGDIDLIAVVRVREFDHLSTAIADRIAKIPGIANTSTHLAFQAYQQHDVEAGFDL